MENWKLSMEEWARNSDISKNILRHFLEDFKLPERNVLEQFLEGLKMLEFPEEGSNIILNANRSESHKPV